MIKAATSKPMPVLSFLVDEGEMRQGGTFVLEVSVLNTPTESQLQVLYAAQTREAGGNWAIRRSDGLDCIDCGWLTEDYYLTDAAKKLLRKIEHLAHGQIC
jgi:hypothetical protein